MTISTTKPDSMNYRLSRRRSLSMSNLADIASSSDEPDGKSPDNENMIPASQRYKKERRTSAANRSVHNNHGFRKKAIEEKESTTANVGCSSRGEKRVSNHCSVFDMKSRGKSVDEIIDDMRMQEFKESPSYLHRRRSLSLSNIATLGEQLDALRGGKKKKVIQAVQHSLNHFKSRNWKIKSTSLGGIGGSASALSDLNGHCDVHRTHQHSRSKSLFSRSNRKDSKAKDVGKEDLDSLKNGCNCTGDILTVEESRMLQTEDDLIALTSRVDKIENEHESLKCEARGLKQTIKEITEKIREKTSHTKHLQQRLDHQLSQWDDFTELRQNEMATMKSHMVHTVERIERLDYRFQQRTTDLEEEVQNCETAIRKIEKQQEELTNDLVQLDGKILLSKIVSFLFNLCALAVVLISSSLKLVVPILCHRTRSLASIAIIIAIGIWINCRKR